MGVKDEIIASLAQNLADYAGLPKDTEYQVTGTVPFEKASTLPGYHDLLNHLCTELGVPGSPTFYEAVAFRQRASAYLRVSGYSFYCTPCGI